MKKHLLSFAFAFALLASVAILRADTSYLLIQGPFGTSGAVTTFQWQVNYQNGALQTGQDLLMAVFGSPSLSGTYTDGFAQTYNNWVAGNSTQGIDFIDFNKDPNTASTLTSPFLLSLTLNSTTVAMDPSYDPGWNYYVAGGSGAQNYDNNGVWTYSGDGMTTRALANGSFDAWVIGETFPAVPVDGAGNTPTTPNFAGATVVNFVPEPASASLVLLCGGGLLALRKRRRV